MVAVLFLVVIATSIWVAADAANQANRGNPLGSAVGWFFGCLLLWIIFFPFYLIKRASSQGRHPQPPLVERIATQVRPIPAPAGPTSPATSVAEELKSFAELHKAGVLTDDEFNAQKARLLGGGGASAALCAACGSLVRPGTAFCISCGNPTSRTS